MDRKKELKMQYKEMKIPAGVFQVKNNQNQKIFIGSSMNLQASRNRFEMGYLQNEILQKEYNEYGKEAFGFEVLEVLEIKEEGYFDPADSLKKIEKKWLDRLKPYGGRGYNKEKDID